MFEISLELLIAIAATQLIFSFYGAGVRRPFGSLATVSDLPQWARKAHWLIKTADAGYLIFLIAMWVGFFSRGGAAAVIAVAFLWTIIGEILIKYIRILPSFALSLALVP